MTSPWVQTFTGRRVELLAPDPESIAIEDIAHAIARINRYSGATREAYSVAQHSLHVADLVARETDDPTVILAALLHDAHEAYLGDITSPVKAAIASDFAQVRSMPIAMNPLVALDIRLAWAVRERFRYAPTVDEYKLIGRADLVALATEKRDLFTVQRDWGPLPEPDEKRIYVISPASAVEEDFMLRFERLTAARGKGVAGG